MPQFLAEDFRALVNKLDEYIVSMGETDESTDAEDQDTKVTNGGTDDASLDSV